MLTFQTFASGSSGNAALLSWGEIHILIDLGISCRRLSRALADRGLTPGDLTALCVTHEHADHIAGLQTFVKKHRVPILCSPGTARQLSCRIAGAEALLAPFPSGGALEAEGMRITSFPLSHDAREGTGFRFDCPEGSVGVLTDTGYVPDEARELLPGVDLLVLEANHDPETLRSGPYPYPLKERVLGIFGHLSNEAAARFALEAAERGTAQILLAHLSAENNTPAMALRAVGGRLEAAGYGGGLAVAPRSEAGRLWQVGGVPCGKGAARR